MIEKNFIGPKEPGDEVEISFELTEENVIPKTGGIINVKTTSYKQDNSSAREEMLVSFVPENSGYYTFHNQLKSEVNCSSSIYEESVNDNGSVLDWKASTYGTPGSNIVELEAGKKYYYFTILNGIWQPAIQAVWKFFSSFWRNGGICARG